MTQPPKITDDQRNRLKILEPALRNAARIGNYDVAKKFALSIQQILRPTGHETRLMQSKNWLFEAAMEAGELETAITGFIGIKKKTSNHTRVHLEATALLAICYLRKRNFDQAETLIAEVLRNDKVIKSRTRRRGFRRRIIQRFEEETALAALEGSATDPLKIDEVQRDAGLLIQTKTDDEIYETLGQSVPKKAADIILKVDQFAIKQLPTYERKYLPNPQDRIKQAQLGKTVFAAIRRVIWRSLCDKQSDVYKAWFEGGIKLVLDKKYIASAVIALLAGHAIGKAMLLTPV